ncbi:sulfurtransferase complex subunit TusB [Methanosarcina sp. Z-7115]|uniref:Sulfurtransferase complex subunit TusB n=1 Tax=Methanosarcina baikalica TaxID=3073890 RepID=A0ABU2CY75_9EURY|nr:sulfurtransferase complex subunit TusB [Methanosarcina sp. Z-7115]MDR7664699.1 sulfurtransferase complex subunit TusB [Methanosarcina sp. Z-7115]
MRQEKLDVFLLTKPPFSPRSELCLKLATRSGKARIYLAGDGVYHLLAGIEELPECEIYACKEDLEARAIKAGEKVTVPDDFYADFIENIMEHCRHEYTF